jgi:hypothetical protein
MKLIPIATISATCWYAAKRSKCSRLCELPSSAWSGVLVATNSDKARQAETHKRAGKAVRPLLEQAKSDTRLNGLFAAVHQNP